MSWKDESEPNNKYCFVGTDGMVQRFITTQNFGHNRRRTNAIRVEYFPRIHLIAACPRSPRVHEQSERTRTIPMHELSSCRCPVPSYGELRTMKKKECSAHSTLVSLFAKRFPAGHLSFLGLGPETKWYSTNKERPGRKWDRVAELMMIKFGESGHPVFRATSQLSRGTLKSKRSGKLSIHFCADGDTIELFFAQSFLSISSVSTEQFQICVKNTVAVKQEQGDLLWQSNLTQDFSYSWKNMDWFWTRYSVRSCVPIGKKNKHSSATRRTSSRRRWSDRILETEIWSSEQHWVLSILVWWCMEEQDGMRRRQQEKISILYWPVRTRNSSPSSSSRSFRTQSHWSFTAGQCIDSEQFLRVHSSYWRCGQSTLHHKFRIDRGRTKI